MQLVWEIITPAFLGGANNKFAELRTPSFKGQLRFWWRAMHGHLPLKELKQSEGELFGNVGEGATRSPFMMLLHTSSPLRQSDAQLPGGSIREGKFPVDILAYLAYGPYENAKNLRKSVPNRQYLVPGQKFELILRGQPTRLRQLVPALKVMSLFGGLGSRSRNGFGSIQASFDESVDGMSETIAINEKYPPFAAFSRFSTYWRTQLDFDKYELALAEIGKAYRRARLNLENPHKYERRSRIASPLLSKSPAERYAKPYFMGVRKNSSGKFFGQILFLPHEYGFSLNESGSLRPGVAFDKDKEQQKFLDATGALNAELDVDLRREPLRGLL